MSTTVIASDAASRSAVRPSPARQRLLDAATELFYREGIHSVGVDRIIEAAGVTRATMYKQFDGKEGLVLAYLDGEDQQLRGLFAQAAGRVVRSARAARPHDRGYRARHPRAPHARLPLHQRGGRVPRRRPGARR